jgi:DDE superfamily endonuclease
MEDILYQYALPYDPLRPWICFDERPCQLLGDVLVPLPMKPGRPQRQDYEYERHGTCCVLLAFDPHRGFRYLEVRPRRTALDYAQFMQTLVQQYYPTVEGIRLVQDNLNTHTPGSFYQALPPEQAFDFAQKFELHYTPKKGSWLNMAEIELAALSKQCLDRRIADQETLAKEACVWQHQRNCARTTVQWRFTQRDARCKLQSKYPALTN